MMIAALLLTLATAQPGDERVIRQRAVAGWRVAYIAESDGGRLIRMHRRANGIRLQFSIAFWHGNAERTQATLIERSDCTDGDYLYPALGSQERDVRALFDRHLATCAATPAQARAALSGFALAHALAARWANEAAASTDAERRAIADYGREPGQ